MNFGDETVVITGGTSGIGKELVQQLAGKCKEVIVIARNQRALNDLANAFNNVVCYACSVDKKEELEPIVDEIIKNHPEVSVFINNAGIQNTSTFLDDDFNYGGIELEVKINFIAPLWITALVLGHFIESKKNTAFVNVTSGLALYPKASSAVYCATKAGLRSFSKSLRYQLEGTNVSVIEAIMPIVDTPMTRGRGRKKMKASEAANALIEGVEAGKDEIYIGISRLIPIVSRISPKLMASILKRG